MGNEEKKEEVLSEVESTPESIEISEPTATEVVEEAAEEVLE